MNTVTRSLGTRILRFNRETNSAKIIQKFTVRPRGAVAQSPPEYVTGVR